MLATAQALPQQLQRVARGEVGLLRIGFSSTLPLTKVLRDVVADHRRSHPDVALNLREMHSQLQFDGLRRGELDVGLVRYNERAPEGIALRLLRRDPLRLVVPAGHRFARRRSVTIADCRDEAFIGFPGDAGTGTGPLLKRLAAQAGFEPRIAQEAREATTQIGRGKYSVIRDGAVVSFQSFIDVIVFPDKERTEFTGDGIRTIQTNVGDTGWLFDGAVKKISDQSPAQVEDFKRAMKTGLEYLLRGNWKKDGGKITYVGRREAGVGKRNEAIRLTDPDGYWIEYEFGARDGLPAKIIYKRMRKDPDSGDMVETTEEDQLLKFIEVAGVTAPWVVDHFVNGKQISRINYESVQYNQRFPDNLFAKPADVKAIK